MNAQLEARLIVLDQAEAVHRVMASNAQYSQLVNGAEPAPDAAEDVLTPLPPKVDVTQKLDLGRAVLLRACGVDGSHLGTANRNPLDVPQLTKRG